MHGENGTPITPDWIPQSREAPAWIPVELKMPLRFEGDDT